MELDLGQGGNPLQSVVQQVIFEKNLMTKLEVTDTLINALSDDVAKNTKAKAFQKELHLLFNNPHFMRRLAYISTLMENVELAVEYLGKDYLSSQDYNYDSGFERKTIEIKKKLQVFLGVLLKELSKGEEIEL